MGRKSLFLSRLSHGVRAAQATGASVAIHHVVRADAPKARANRTQLGADPAPKTVVERTLQGARLRLLRNCLKGAVSLRHVPLHFAAQFVNDFAGRSTAVAGGHVVERTADRRDVLGALFGRGMFDLPQVGQFDDRPIGIGRRQPLSGKLIEAVEVVL